MNTRIARRSRPQHKLAATSSEVNRPIAQQPAMSTSSGLGALANPYSRYPRVQRRPSRYLQPICCSVVDAIVCNAKNNNSDNFETRFESSDIVENCYRLSSKLSDKVNPHIGRCSTVNQPVSVQLSVNSVGMETAL